MKARQIGPARAAAAPSQAFETVFLEHWGMVYRLLVRMLGDPDEAEDLALETFFKLYQRPPQSGEGSSLKGWLFRVATNKGLHAIRSAQRRRRYELAAGRDACDDPPEDRPAEILDRREADRLARLALGQLPPRQARLLSLRYSGMAYKDLAAALGLAPASIGPLLLRAEREFVRIYRSITREET